MEKGKGGRHGSKTTSESATSTATVPKLPSIYSLDAKEAAITSSDASTVFITQLITDRRKQRRRQQLVQDIDTYGA